MSSSEHLSVLAWMVANDRLEIRVGVPRDGDGHLLTHQESGRYFHTKYGIFTDRYGNKVAFNGSNNASVTAWVKNHETFDAYPSWNAPIWEYIGEHKVQDFEKHWNQNADAGWAVIDLPSAVQQHLIEHAPDAPPLPPAASSLRPGRAGRRPDEDVELRRRGGLGRTRRPARRAYRSLDGRVSARPGRSRCRTRPNSSTASSRPTRVATSSPTRLGSGRPSRLAWSSANSSPPAGPRRLCCSSRPR